MCLHHLSLQGEEQKKLDVISNDIFCNCLRNSGRTGVIASEEEATPVAVEETDSGNYIVVFDPLDGSSNIDAGGHWLQLFPEQWQRSSLALGWRGWLVAVFKQGLNAVQHSGTRFGHGCVLKTSCANG